MVRLTVRIPEEFHQRVKEILPQEGFTTINDYLLDLLRHQFGESKRQNGGIKVKMGENELEVKAPAEDKVEQAELRHKVKNVDRDLSVCEHGYIKKLCPECKEN